ncbi:MAG TPA: hypothetical protein VM328_00505, partial [Fimbriimonadaceae bacterium]|nr:hypothetical protein [Fimbriimonadaceae bacterium]
MFHLLGLEEEELQAEQVEPKVDLNWESCGKGRILKVVMNGTGYVGLTTGSALAYIGHEVTCVDIDERKIEALRGGISPIYEPGLEELIKLCNGHLHFTTDVARAVADADVVFIAVGTPPAPDGAPDLRYVSAAARAVGEHLGEQFTVVVNKSTVPIGSGNWVEALIREAFEEKRGEKPNG